MKKQAPRLHHKKTRAARAGDDMATENPGPDDEPSPDPFDAELVAYLDGELEPAAARKVEARLARDPAARARAAELKKSFDMLDYLPKPEPSPTFTTRTLDKLPAVKSTTAAKPVPPTASRADTPKPRPVPAASASTSMPVALEIEDEPDPPPPPRRRFVRIAGLCAAVGVCAIIGYVATAAVRPSLSSGRDKEIGEVKGEVDPRVIENLPLYAVADDIAFVTELTKPEYFGDDPAVAFEPGLKISHGEAVRKMSAEQLDALIKSFRALPAARRAEIVKLDEDLEALDPATRERHFRALEAYAVWLDWLPESDRRGVLTAATPGLRLKVIRDIREQLWTEALPQSVRTKPERIAQWREDESLRRERSAFVRRHAEAFAKKKSPWPFDTPEGQEEVLKYAREVLKVDAKADDRLKCRLSSEELGEYRRVLQVARSEDAWAWYGLFVYEVANHHPYLPEPDSPPKLMYAEVSELPSEVGALLNRKGGMGMPAGPPALLKAQTGRWPEFPLEAHRELSRNKFVAAKTSQLGPAKLGELKPAVRTFAEKDLFPKMTAEEKRELERAVGRWPDYPQRLLSYAHKYDLPVPGVTLPFAPSKWDATYGTHPVPPK